ncbi:hypothetical protein LMH87_006515 [Akanthomyces muscarius]|uniref:Zn(2)-C6 fungal-type domain-containing protein n=1 Tax=Akanthomyces muscarius TaxID=2231603 RepID=A0A9W8USW5_AKAMU|nr:hypothetical protein LMH87_006515 [Akanthomyces muscarius]KAJ4164860.1 hypothetical protein LMH87_006515 [Akanthomyces muscarius]
MVPTYASDNSSSPESQISPPAAAGQQHVLTFSSSPDEPSTTSILPKRQKRFAAKVKTGCMTCRRRRIKCDEGKPSCKKCSSSGRDCEYPPISFRFAVNKSIEAMPVQHKPLHIQPKLSIAPHGIRVSRQESHIFDLFRLRTVHQVGGSFNHAFWAGDVLRAARVYPAVWHACLSFAALDHRAKKPTAPEVDKNTLYAFSLLQHNASIRHMVKIAQQTSPSYADQETFMLRCAEAKLAFPMVTLPGDIAKIEDYDGTIREYKSRLAVWSSKFKALLDTQPDNASTKHGAIQLQLMEVAVNQRQSKASTAKDFRIPFVAAMCAAVIDLEEGTWYEARSIAPDVCTCVHEEFICNNHRVGRLELKMSPPGQASVHFRSVSDVRHQREGLTKAVSMGEARAR